MKVLYLHHSGALSGSTNSLLFTIQGLAKYGIEPIVVLAEPSPGVCSFLENRGVRAYYQPGLTMWHHSTGGYRPLYSPATWIYLLRVFISRGKNERVLGALIAKENPDLVHLNSMVFSLSADVLKKRKVPFVWHTREHPPREWFNWRTKIIRRIMLRHSDSLIFISNADRKAWCGREDVGRVVHNFVDLDRFKPDVDGAPKRKTLGIRQQDLVVLFLGGPRVIKGIFPLLMAIAGVRKSIPRIKLVLPDFIFDTSGKVLSLVRALLPLVGMGTTFQRIHAMVKSLGLADICIMCRFDPAAECLIAASQVLVFPSIRPHFARPVIEAAVMEKPSIASRLPGMEELILDGETGLLVPPGDHRALADAIVELLTNRDKTNRMGKRGRVFASERFSAEKNCRRIADSYAAAVTRSLKA